MKKIKYTEIIRDLEKHGLMLLTNEAEYKNTSTPLVITNGVYKIVETYRTYSGKHAEPTWFSKNNPYIIYNINKYFEKNRCNNFICISSPNDYIDRETTLQFKCNRCNRIIKAKWMTEIKAISDKYDSRHGIVCKNCDGANESLHALALKQIYMHTYPDTILEDKSCKNPRTNTVMPTDIVNHRLKIAIEIQGQFHNRENQKTRDKIKKCFWINKGYSFYDYSIEKISVLDYVRLFFPRMKKLPEYVDLNYCSKINFDYVQKQLNQNIRVSQMAKDMGVSAHRIYDAIYSGKLYYPNNYNKKTTIPIVQLDKCGNLVARYSSFKEAEKSTNIKANLISSCLYYENYYCKGYYWFYETDYNNKTYHIPRCRTDKFYQKVNCYDMNDKFLKTFDNMYEAAKFVKQIRQKFMK